MKGFIRRISILKRKNPKSPWTTGHNILTPSEYGSYKYIFARKSNDDIKCSGEVQRYKLVHIWTHDRVH